MYSESDLQRNKVKFLLEPSVSSPGGMEVDPVEVEPSWIDPIVTYLTTGDQPSEKTKARRVRYRAARYHLINRVLYKKGFTIPYL